MNMKILNLFLALTVILQLRPVYAQTTERANVTVKPKTCQEKIQEKLDKLPSTTKTVLGGAVGYGAGYAIGFFSLSAGVWLGGAALATGASTAGLTILAVRKHRKNILKIFEGAAKGGNRKTEKLWKLALKKNLDAFKGVTYEQFLAAIHESDISGKACEIETIPERKEIVNVVIDLKELEDDNAIVGEQSKSKRAANSDKSRQDVKDQSSPEKVNDDLPAGVNPE